VSYPVYAALRAAAGDAADAFGFSFVREANLSIDGVATTSAAALVSGNYFRGSGAAIVLGRPLTDDDDRPGGSTAVISHRLWMNAMGGDPAAIGKTIRVNGVPFTIVGVSGPGFLGMSRGGFSRLWTSAFRCGRSLLSRQTGQRRDRRCSSATACSGSTSWRA
jgi:hypothetical protein